MDKIDRIIKEVIDSYLQDELLCEMAMKPSRMIDKYGEVLGAIVDNLVCICLYPDNPTVLHWRERAYGLCKRFVDIDIDPLKKNNIDFRYECLSKAVVEILNADFSAIENHFNSVSVHYANMSDPHKRLTPTKPVKECYEENKERVKNGVLALTKYVAAQDYAGMIKYMETF